MKKEVKTMNETMRKRTGFERVDSLDQIIDILRKNIKPLAFMLLVGLFSGFLLYPAVSEPSVITNTVVLTKEQIVFKPFSGNGNMEYACKSDLCALELDARNIDGFKGFRSSELGGSFSSPFTAMTLRKNLGTQDITITAIAEKEGQLTEEKINIKFG